MFFVCQIFGHRQSDPHVRVRYALRSSFVHLTLTCTRCGSTLESFTEHRYDIQALATFTNMQDYVNADVESLEALYILEAQA